MSLIANSLGNPGAEISGMSCTIDNLTMVQNLFLEHIYIYYIYVLLERHLSHIIDHNSMIYGIFMFLPGFFSNVHV